MELTEQKRLIDGFMTWFEGGGTGSQTSLRNVIEDNRRRYRMLPSADDQMRKQRNLSALTSPKSRAIVSGIRDAFLAEYHGEKDSISFTSRRVGDVMADSQALWLTEIFSYRIANTFPFYAWHSQSIVNGLVDGMEAAIVSWKHEFYEDQLPPTYEVPHPETGQPIQVSEQQAAAAEMQGIPVRQVPQVDRNVVADTFWVDSLIAGETVFWDYTVPLLDVNLGSFAAAVIYKTLDECMWLAQQGVFDLAAPEDLEQYRRPRMDWQFTDQYKTFGDPHSVDCKDLNRIPVMIFFKKVGFRWMVQFSIDSKVALSNWAEVNNVFFNGRKVNKLPIVIGKCETALYESTGVGMPYLIASHEDEWSRNRNDIQDAARMALTQKWRITRGSDANIDDIMNRPAFYADMGEVERIDARVDIISAQRGNDQIDSEILQLAPSTISQRGRSIVPRGANATLGAAQMMDQDSTTKRNAQMMLRNESFLKPLMLLIAELIFAFESDEQIVRIAGQKAGFPVPNSIGPSGQPLVNFNALDFPVNCTINAGMGNIPPQQKAMVLMQIADWRNAHHIPTNIQAIGQQINVLAGFEAESFDAPPPPPPPPPVDYKLNVTMDMALLPEPAQAMLMQKLMTGQMSVTGNIPDPAIQAAAAQRQQNGGMGAPPIRSGAPAPDMTHGPAAAGMSMGGQHAPQH